MNILKKTQNQPEHIRKIIFWVIVIILGLGLLTWWFKNISHKLRSFQKEKFIEELGLPSFEGGLKEIPNIEIPEIKDYEK